jgi:Uma2 family endonuclease
VAVFTSEEQSLLLNENDQLSGEDLLPGFHLSIRELFSRLDRQAN